MEIKCYKSHNKILCHYYNSPFTTFFGPFLQGGVALYVHLAELDHHNIHVGDLEVTIHSRTNTK